MIKIFFSALIVLGGYFFDSCAYARKEKQCDSALGILQKPDGQSLWSPTELGQLRSMLAMRGSSQPVKKTRLFRLSANQVKKIVVQQPISWLSSIRSDRKPQLALRKTTRALITYAKEHPESDSVNTFLNYLFYEAVPGLEVMGQDPDFVQVLKALQSSYSAS